MFDWIAIGVALAIMYYAGYTSGLRVGHARAQEHWTQDEEIRRFNRW